MDQTEGRMMSIHNLATERIVVWPVSLLRKGKFLLSKVIHVHHFKMSNRENYKQDAITHGLSMWKVDVFLFYSSDAESELHNCTGNLRFFALRN